MLIDGGEHNSGRVTVKEQVCAPDIQVLAVSFHPRWLPRSFHLCYLATLQVASSAQLLPGYN